MKLITALVASAVLLATNVSAQKSEPIPLPEHPRPDFQRPDWQNLNGRWQFKFDAKNEGQKSGWYNAKFTTPHSILVPFSWGAPLSGVPDSADIGWYQRSITIPESWRGKRVFLVVGASDWRTSVWMNNAKVGEHQGGYTPFSVELTKNAMFGTPQRLTLRVDDTNHPFKLEGKQGYGKARGMWQTVYLEARGADPLEYAHFTPNIRTGQVAVSAKLRDPAPANMTLSLGFRRADDASSTASVQLPARVEQRVAKGESEVKFNVAIPNPRLWSLEDPYLYNASVALRGDGVVTDSVDTYFGMREVSVVNMPGTTIPYVALNGKPVYMQLALDQAYHPTGFYTFPTDSALRNEILMARQIGLNGLREHIKIEAPRKLYWADRLGVLIMADVPNWWGPPDSAAFAEHDYAMREMIARDYNHPAVFSWVAYNEAWGIVSKVDKKDVYLPGTQKRVVESVMLAKQLDPTRLVEDNSPCCGRGHTVTDINTWHNYLPGWEWEKHLGMIEDSTRAGSPWNFEKGYVQGTQPMFNSEFGNVWGYKGSTGDVDWSWDYHRAVNTFRRHPKLAGWLYTELHDVINEWNGYVRADRSWKETGMGALADGMSLRDLHSPFYLVVGSDLEVRAKPGETIQVPLYASFLSDSRTVGDSLTVRYELAGWNGVGERRIYSSGSRKITYSPWMTAQLAPLSVTMPGEPTATVLSTRLEDASGTVLHRNFTTMVVEGTPPRDVRLADGSRARLASVSPTAYRDSKWSGKTWAVLDSLKANGTGSGYFEYRIAWPSDVLSSSVSSAVFLVEASSKRLLGKDRDTLAKGDGDYMRGGGLQDPGRNRNAYPMTGETLYPSAVTVRVNGEVAGTYELSDDPADHRGILSWFSQKRDGYLREAGSYGQLLRVTVPGAALQKAAASGEVIVRLEVTDALPGGLAIYGSHFGRYPLDPTVAFILKSGTPGTASAPSTQASRDSADVQRLREDWAGLRRYRAANALLAAQPKDENRVVFYGNSITDGWARHFPTMFPGKPYVGRGISGQTTPQMLVRFQQDVVALAPKVVVILAGTNDIAGNTGPSTLEMIEDNLMAMTQIAKANNIRVVLSSVLPVYDYPWKPGLQPAPKIIALNAWMKKYAEQTGETYLDYHSVMADERGGLPASTASDGVHPNESGYRTMATLVSAAIAQALSRR